MSRGAESVGSFAAIPAPRRWAATWCRIRRLQHEPGANAYAARCAPVRAGFVRRRGRCSAGTGPALGLPSFADSTRETPVVRLTTSLLAAQHVLALRHHHIAGQRDGVACHVEDAEIAGGGLILLVTTTPPRASSRLIFCSPAGPTEAVRMAARLWRSWRPCAVVLLVEHDQRLAAHGRVALLDVHVAGESRDLVLVAHFQRRRLDMHRLTAVLREALQRVRRAFRRLRARRRRRDGDAQAPANKKAPRKLPHGFALPALPAALVGLVCRLIEHQYHIHAAVEAHEIAGIRRSPAGWRRACLAAI